MSIYHFNTTPSESILIVNPSTMGWTIGIMSFTIMFLAACLIGVVLYLVFGNNKGVSGSV